MGRRQDQRAGQEIVSGSCGIKAVTFDVGGTLIEPWPSVGHVYADVAAQHGLKNISAESLNARFKSAWQARRDFDYTRSGWEDLVNQTFRGLVPERERVHFFSELYDRFGDPDAWRIFDDVRPVLNALAPLGLRLGVISNWDERLRPLLRKLQLHDCFETCSISCEVGSPKPSPIIFARAARGFGLAPDSILHVGDSFEMDVAGAKSAGFHALQLRRDLEQSGAGRIHSLAELPAWIALPISRH
jgi:putative hydrolase of the HAD superfamily